MASALVRELLDAGIHFGHQCSRWNPKMKPYIYGKRNGIHIIDIRETLRGLLRARKFLTQLVAGGEDVLFVGTKRQAREVVEKEAGRCNMHYVSERWLGGTLTNFRTIRGRLQRLEELESLVGSPVWETDYSKKMKSTLSRELKKIQRNLNGIRKMNRLPSALVLVDVRKEHNAVREAQALGIPTIALLDTDSDPELTNIPIPGNDDSMRSIALVLRYLADAVEEGFKARPEPRPQAEQPEGSEFGAPPPRRRGRRPMPMGHGAPGGPEPARTAVATTEEESPAAPEAQPAHDFGVQAQGNAPA
ncbi:MAG: 30S ribosomal protein S2 [Phycisphaerae bacterium]|nr:30S ribosomal protein S2 [Phycisphaerae bacterium]